MTRNEAVGAAESTPISGAVIFLLSLACGIVVADIYYVQPLVGLISRGYGMPVTSAGLLVTVTQAGYAVGLIFIVPLGDTVENRKLILAMLTVLVIALLAIFNARSASVFLAASVVVGLMSSAVQIMVPFAGHLASDANRGRVVGTVVSGLLFGVMLSRPTASFFAHFCGPQSIFAVSAGAVMALGLMLAVWLPERRPHGIPYLRALVSLGPLLAHTATLHRRSGYQAALFGCFSLFWTAIPLLLEGPRFNFSQIGIGIFALVGAGGALVSPLAGRAADAGYGHRITGVALGGAGIAFLIAFVGGLLASWPLLVIAGVILDMATAAHLVTGQRDIFALGAEARGRLNGLYLALFFVGGALGSLAAGIAYAHGGWTGTCLAGLAFTLAGLGYFATDEGWTKAKAGRARGAR